MENGDILSPSPKGVCCCFLETVTKTVDFWRKYGQFSSPFYRRVLFSIIILTFCPGHNSALKRSKSTAHRNRRRPF